MEDKSVINKSLAEYDFNQQKSVLYRCADFIEPNIQIIINNKGSIHVIRLLLAQKEDLHVTSQSAAVSHCISFFINSFYHPEVKSYQR